MFQLVFAPNSHLSCDTSTTSNTSWDSSSECYTTLSENVKSFPAENGIPDEPMKASVLSSELHLQHLLYLDSELSHTFGRLTATIVPPLICDVLYGVDIFPDQGGEEQPTAFPSWNPHCSNPESEAEEWVIVLSSLIHDQPDPLASMKSPP